MDTLTLPPPVLGQTASGAQAGASPADQGSPRRRQLPDAFAVGLALLVVLATFLAILVGSMVVRGRAAAPSPRYRTETVTRGQVTGVLRVPARVVPRAIIRVGSERVGRVVAVNVSPGERVKRGQVLARLDDRELKALAIGGRASLLAARVNLKQAQMRLAQIVYLLQNKDDTDDSLTPEELQAAALEAEVAVVNDAAELKKQEAALAATMTLLEGTSLRAPFDGVVLSRTVEPGETVAAGTSLLAIGADPTEMQVVASLDDGDVSRLQPGKATFVVPALPDRVFQAHLGAIEPTLPASASDRGGDQANGYRVRLTAANGELNLRPGMSATLSLPLTSAREALQVPVEALQPSTETGEHRAAVYVLDGARRPQRVPVEVGVTDGRVVEVRSASLAPGASVILGRGDRELE